MDSLMQQNNIIHILQTQLSKIKKTLYTGVVIVERPLSDEKNDQISERFFKERPAIAQISQ